MTYVLTFVVRRGAEAPQVLTTRIAGCADAADAERKLRAAYRDVVAVRKVEAVA